jgi:thiol:disulfide interchange protein DsbD
MNRDAQRQGATSLRRFGQITRILAVVPLLLALAGTAIASAPVTTDHVTARILPEATAARPGDTVWVMLHLRIKEGWHTYWRNPGDSGEPPHIKWTLPDGVEAGDIHWPYPDPLPYGPLLNYGYSREAFHLVPIRVAESWPQNAPIRLQAKVGWLACSDICVPEGGSFDLTLDAAAAPQTDPATADLFRKARERLPVKPDWKAGFGRNGDKVVLTITGSGLRADKVEKAAFFPYKWGVVEPSAPQTLGAAPNGLSLTLTPGQTPNTERLEGVLVLTETGGNPATRGYEISAAAGAQQGAVTAPPAGAPATGAGDKPGTPGTAADMSIVAALLFAVLGGIILNLMPCVFPVLSMKAMALIRHAEKDTRTVRRHGMAYALGVLTCFAVLAGLLIALKAGGAAAGWGFQLQSPLFVAAMAYLFFLLGLNLSGVFEFGSAIMGLGGNLSAREGYGGSYFTGVLAAVVSTPCTAPFMGAALGYALTQSAPVSIGIFLALGFGFALPYLLLTFVPPLVRLLPRPGAWMVRTRQFLAFPLYASVAWLIWVLGIQTGPDGVLAALAGLILIAFGLWLMNVAREAGARGRLIGRIGTAAAMIAALAVIAGLDINSQPAESVRAPGQSADGPKAESFSSERLAALRASGKPVFVNMTAAWCITCLVNERVALSSETVATQFDSLGITYLKGDWTNGDPEITALLESFGRSGVPLYVLYGPDNAEPVLLPQLLTESLVLDALRDLPSKSKLTANPDRRNL